MKAGLSGIGKVGKLLGGFLLASHKARKKFDDPKELRQFFVNNTSYYSDQILSAVNFETEAINFDKSMFKDESYFVVCNHMSYIDILVMARMIPSVFVTSTEMRDTFFLGDVCEAGGSLFVERRSRKRLSEDLKMVGDVMNEGFNLVVYPEGTSGDGTTILPFKHGLFATALTLQKRILPVCIKYKEINGETFGPHNRDMICWYGDMTFAPHFYNLKNIESVKVEISFLEPIDPKVHTDRATVSEMARDQIFKEYHKDGFGDPNGTIDPSILKRVPNSPKSPQANS